MSRAYWPLFDLTLRTPRLVLRPPTDEDFPALLAAIDIGIHDADAMPFTIPWTDAAPDERRRSAVQFWWRERATWSTAEWHLPFAVFHEGQAIGVQEVFAKEFVTLREVTTASWLCVPAQGQGFGKEMRAAILQFVFEELGAEIARSGAFVDNEASLAVSRSFGYRENGFSRAAPRGIPRATVNLELTRGEWEARRHSFAVAEVSGFDACRSMFTEFT